MAFPGFELKDKVMLITGSGKGIGRGIALAAAQMGAKVILNSRTPSDLEEVASEIRTNGGEAESVVFDVSDIAQVAKGAQEAIDVWGRVDVLVNNAGTNRPKPALELTEEDWDAIYDLQSQRTVLLDTDTCETDDRKRKRENYQYLINDGIGRRSATDCLFRKQGGRGVANKRTRS